MSGSAISAFTPQMIVVLPMRTRAEPSAVDIEPGNRVVQSFNGRKDAFFYPGSGRPLATRQTRAHRAVCFLKENAQSTPVGAIFEM